MTKLEQAARELLEAMWCKSLRVIAQKEAALRAALAEPKKPEECANGCPPLQVCDYCQKVEQAEQEPSGFTAEQQDRFAAAFDVAFAKAGLPQKKQAKQEPVCKRCHGTKLVFDGEIDNIGGVPLEVPIECVKDCPDCSVPVQPVKQEPELPYHPCTGILIDALKDLGEYGEKILTRWDKCRAIEDAKFMEKNK